MNVNAQFGLDGQCRVSIVGDMTVYHAMRLKNELLASLAQCSGMEVDLARVGEIDPIGLQVMVVLKREADALGKTLRFVGHSRAVRALMDSCNVTGFFGDPLLTGSKAYESVTSN